MRRRLLAKVFGRQERDAVRYRASNELLARLRVRQLLVGRVCFAVVSTFFASTPVLVYVLAGVQIAGREGLSAGAASMAPFTRVFAYLDREADIVESPTAEALPVDRVVGEVRLQDVRFSYESEPGPDSERPRRWALQGLDLHVRPGPLAAVVRASGAGKTTSSYLVPRLYAAASGTVCLDGHDVRDLTLNSRSGAIGMVTQETDLVRAAVRENLSHANPDATLEQVVDAARAAQIHERILELENGYDTVVGERGPVASR